METINDVVDCVTSVVEKVSSPSSRAGSTIERAGKMLEADISEDVIALQMSKNSPNQETYSGDDVRAYGKLFEDAKTKVLLTAKQTRSLIKDQKEATFNGLTPSYQS